MSAADGSSPQPADPKNTNGTVSVEMFRDSIFATTGEPLSMVYKDLTYQIKIKQKVEIEDEAPTTDQAEGDEKEEKKRRRKKRKVKKKSIIIEKDILKSIAGVFRPGRLTAIMGASGAGKTSLLSVLAGQVASGNVTGQIMINGEDYSEPGQMQQVSGFVFQDDVLLPTMKVKEAIRMSALLRLPDSVSEEERARRVDEIVRILHLTKAAKTRVGDPLKKGISGGERKRTSIAMEIITNPAMLFLDEPTSGLDTYTAYTVVKTLQNLSHRQGRTIVATIHQPSSDIFYLFDDLLILAEGQVAYYGTIKGSIGYFAELGYPCPQYSNPADYFFMNILSDLDGKSKLVSAEAGSNSDSEDAVGVEPVQPTMLVTAEEKARRRQTRPISWLPPGIKESSEARIKRVLEYWPQSPEYEEMLRLIEEQSSAGVGAISFKGQASYWTQFGFLLSRASKNALRNPMIVRVRLIQSVFIGLLLGLVYLNQNQYTPNEQIQNKAGVLFFIAVNQFFGAANQVLAIFYEEKTVFFREFQAGYYRLSAYYWSKVLVELPYQLIFPFLLVIIAYYMVGLNPSFAAYLLCATFAALAGISGTATGIFIASIFEEINTALAVLPLILLPLLLFSGLFANSNTFPSYLMWIQYISPIKYAYTGMALNEFQGRQIPNCDFSQEACSGERALAQLGLQNSLGIIPNIVFILVLYVVLTVGAFVILWFKLRRYKPKHPKKKKVQ